MARRWKDEVHRRLRARVRAEAERLGLQLTHVADRAGVSRSHFWDVLAGRKSPTLSWLAKVAAVLGREPKDLLSGDPPVPAPSRKVQRVPLVSMAEAAAAFSESREVRPSGWVDAPARRAVREGMFAAVIRDGSICLFGPLEGGDPAGKVVLVQLRGGRCAVKQLRAAGREPIIAELLEVLVPGPR
ncbi:MAG TPA: helix-turn-helix transcriptional regulator [Myxococcales bacterium]|nr:helix-turn-helix transcriptional regulator [Myxococcales bacterium]